MPNYLTEICTFADLAHPAIHGTPMIKKLSKNGTKIFPLFIVYYLI